MLTWRSTAVRLKGASLMGQLNRSWGNSRCVTHELGLVTSIDYHTVDPAGIAQLSASQKHLVRSYGYFRRCRAGHGRREVERAVVCVQGGVWWFGKEVTAQHRDCVRVGQSGGRRMSLLDLEIRFTGISMVRLVRTHPSRLAVST